ncbi:MAG: hypothetical protein JKY94_16650 [Rhodobacteraceae bacterium]|nr:hypothetical protein [Paracoccaceae bacterium]
MVEDKQDCLHSRLLPLDELTTWATSSSRCLDCQSVIRVSQGVRRVYTEVQATKKWKAWLRLVANDDHRTAAMAQERARTDPYDP